MVQRNLRLLLQGQEAGGVQLRLGRMKDGGTLMESRFELKVKRGNGPRADVFITKSHTLEYADPAGKLRWARSRTEEAGTVRTVFSRYSDKNVDIEFEGPGAKFKKQLELPKDHASDLQIFRRLLGRFRQGEKAHAAYSSLDDDEQVFKSHEMTIVRKATTQHGAESHEGYLLEMVSPMGNTTVISDADFLPMHMTMMGVIEAVWIDGSPFDLASAGWKITSYVPVEGAVPLAPHLMKLEMTATFEKEVPGDKPLFENSRYQEVKRDGETYHLTLLSTRLPADAKPLRVPLVLDDEKIKHFLAPTPLSQSDHASIIARAKKIVGDETDALMAVKRIVLWVFRALDKRGGARGSATAVEVLQSRIGDCSEHAALTVALCRAAGIPARNLGGLVYGVQADKKPVAGWHAWTEVWLGQWVGVDATVAEVGTSARFVLLEIDEPGEDEGTDQMLRAMAGKLRLRVDAYQPAGGKRTVVTR